jgi:hypothetical protein
MIDRKSLFNLNYSTLQTKPSKAGITSKTLKQEQPEINFYINKTDSTDYYFLVVPNDVKLKTGSLDKEGYFRDFLPVSVLDEVPEIEDIIFYIKEDLKELYYASLKTDNRIKELEEKNKVLEEELKALKQKISLIKSIA